MLLQVSVTHLWVAVYLTEHMSLHVCTKRVSLYVTLLEFKCNYAFMHNACVCISDGSICCTTASLWLEPQQLSDHLCSTVTVLSCWMWASQEASAHVSHQGLSSWLICVGTHTHHHLAHCAADTQTDVCVHAHTSRLRVCHSSPERLLGLVLLLALIAARAE